MPLLTINGWIQMQRKVTGGSVSFNENWAEYRDGFGSAAGNDNYWLGQQQQRQQLAYYYYYYYYYYWLGLDKVYRLMQMGHVRLRIEVTASAMLCEYCMLSVYCMSSALLLIN